MRHRHAGAGSHPALRTGLPPALDWPRLLAFLRARCIAGVEQVGDSAYRRTVRVGQGPQAPTGWLEITRAAGREALAVTVSAGLLRALAADAPGLRVPGAFDGFEMSVRAALGQQVTVRAAHTLAGRLVGALGEPLDTPFEALTHLFPTAQRMVEASPDDIGALGRRRWWT